MKSNTLALLFACASLSGCVQDSASQQTLSCKKIAAEKLSDHPPAQHLKKTPVAIHSAEGVKHIFNIEVATTASQWETGLMYRHHMDENGGMLFIGQRQEREFPIWMKNTYIPLDVLFLRKDGTVTHIHENAKPCDETYLWSKNPAIGFLELNAGTTKKLGIRPGDRILPDLKQLD